MRLLVAATAWASATADAATANAGAASAGAGNGNLPLTKIGRTEVRPHVSYSFSRDEGTLVRPGQPADSYRQSFSPGVLLNLGTSCFADYTAAFAHYSNPTLADSVNQRVSLGGAFRNGSGGVQVTQDVESSTQASLELGRQVEQLTSLSSVSGGFAVGPQLQFGGTLSQSLRFVEAAPDSLTWSGSVQLNHSLAGGVALGAGLASSYSATYKTADTFYVGPRGSLSWHPSTKLTFTAAGSLNRAEILTPVRTKRTTPVYSVTADYTIFTHTVLVLTATRSTAPSLLSGQESETEDWNVGLRQRLLGVLRFTSTFGETRTRFRMLTEGAPTSREDNGESLAFSLGLPVIRRGVVSVNYHVRKNRSSDQGFSAKTTQLGLMFAYQY